MRQLSESFMSDLIKTNGLLNPLLEKVKRDKTLMLAIREESINIYYRGGSLLRLDRKPNGLYPAKFDTHYNISGLPEPDYPKVITSREDSLRWVEVFPAFKNMMDEFLSKHEKLEREFQQVVVRENNDSPISGKTEYFITDIELAETEDHARFDLTGIRWLAYDRQTASKCRAVLMEMKYGEGALGGESGISKHLRDLEALIADRPKYAARLADIESQFHQLDRLGLLKFNKGTSNARVSLSAEDKPEVIFILANQNPRSKKLRNILKDSEIARYTDSPLFDLRFFVSMYAGYAMHTDCMLTYKEFMKPFE